MVHARETGLAMFIVDRRLNPGSKSLENRQRFLRRAKALVQGAVLADFVADVLAFLAAFFVGPTFLATFFALRTFFTAGFVNGTK